MKPQRLILIGAGGFGREVAAWIRVLELPFTVVGFLDDSKTGPDILGTVHDHQPLADSVYLTCLGKGPTRGAIRGVLEAKGARFATLIDPTLRTSTAVDGSVNSIFLGMSSIANDVQIGNDLLLHGYAAIGHDVFIGDGVTIGAQAFVGGGASLKSRCTVHPHSTILPGITVNEDAVVGAGSVVIRSVEANATVFGVPAKVIAYGKANA